MGAGVESILKKLLELASIMTGADLAVFFERDPSDPERLIARADSGLKGALDRTVQTRADVGLIGWALKHRRATQARSVQEMGAEAVSYNKTGRVINSFIAIPIRRGSRLIGALTVDKEAAGGFDRRESESLAWLADLIGMTVEKSSTLEKRERDAAAFGSIGSIVEKISAESDPIEAVKIARLSIRELINNELMIFAIRKGADQVALLGSDCRSRSESISLKGCLIGNVIHHNRIVNISDVSSIQIAPTIRSSIWRSFLGAPIGIGGSARWGMALLSRRVGAFDKRAERIMMILARLMSAIEIDSTRSESLNARALDDREAPGPFPSPYKIFKGRGLALVVNLLGFRHVNLELGFKGGETILRSAFERLKTLDPAPIIAARRYADRYTLLFHIDAPEEARAIALKARDRIESESFLSAGVETIIKASVGAALYPDDGVSSEELIERADLAARDGKKIPDRIVFHRDSTPPKSEREERTG